MFDREIFIPVFFIAGIASLSLSSIMAVVIWRKKTQDIIHAIGSETVFFVFVGSIFLSTSAMIKYELLSEFWSVISSVAIGIFMAWRVMVIVGRIELNKKSIIMTGKDLNPESISK